MDSQLRESFHLFTRRRHATRPAKRIRNYTQPIRLGDPATSVVTDFSEEPPSTVDGDRRVSDALDQLFLAGGRALLVVQGDQVIGIVTAEQLRAIGSDDEFGSDERVIAEAMTPVSDIPMIEWETILSATVGDLLEIFDATDYRLLVAVESNGVSRGRVRGLIHRSRLAIRHAP